MRKMVKATVCVLALLATTMLGALAVNGQIDVFVYGVPVRLSSPAVAENGRVLVPFRDIFEALGMTVGWDGATQTVTGHDDTTYISFVLGQTSATVNGVEKQLDTPARAVDGHTLVPVRFVGEASGYDVEWDGTNQRVIVGSKKIQGDILLSSSKQNANVFLLYTAQGAGEYAGYTRILGFPGDKDFSVYYQCTIDGSIKSLHTSYVDLRGLDLKEKVYWNYRDRSYVSTRAEVYGLLSDVTRISSYLGEANSGLFSPEWQRETFGQVYFDWIKIRMFSEDAARIADVYTNYVYGLTTYYYQTGKTADVNSMGEWVNADDLAGADIGYAKFSGSETAQIVFYNLTDGFMRSKQVTISADIPLEFFEKDHGETEYGGVHMKIENGILYFSKSNLALINVFELTNPRQ